MNKKEIINYVNEGAGQVALEIGGMMAGGAIAGKVLDKVLKHKELELKKAKAAADEDTIKKYVGTQYNPNANTSYTEAINPELIKKGLKTAGKALAVGAAWEGGSRVLGDVLGAKEEKRTLDLASKSKDLDDFYNKYPHLNPKVKHGLEPAPVTEGDHGGPEGKDVVPGTIGTMAGVYTGSLIGKRLVKYLKKKKEMKALRDDMLKEASPSNLGRMVAAVGIPFATTTALTAAHQVADYATDPPEEAEAARNRAKRAKMKKDIALKIVNKKEMVRKGLANLQNRYSK